MATTAPPRTGTTAFEPPVNSTDSIRILASEIDPLLLKLGILAGIFIPIDGSADCMLSLAWFEDPVGALRKNVCSQAGGAQLVDLLQELLTSHSGTAIGVPQQGADKRLWYPITLPAAGSSPARPLPLYLVTETVGTTTLAGVGMLYELDVAPFTITANAFVPVLTLPITGSNPFVLGSADHPIEIGVLVAGGSGAFGSSSVSFDGISFGVQLTASQMPTFDVVLKNLRLPGRAPADTPIGDLESLPANEWIASVLSILGEQIAKANPKTADDLRALASDLLALLGLSGDNLPEIDWTYIVAHPNPNAVTSELQGWLRSLVSQPALLQLWLSKLGSALGAPKVNVTGSGSRSDPYAIQLPGLPPSITASLTVAATTDSSQQLHVIPGLRIASATVQPVSSIKSLGACISADVEIVDLLLTGTTPALASALFPSFDVRLELFNPGGGPLVSYDGLTLGSASAGFSYTAIGDGSRHLAPSFALNGVVTGDGTWPTIDLTNFSALVNVVKDGAAQFAQAELNKFFGVDPNGGTSANPRARAFAAVLGLVPPDGFTTATWTPSLLFDKNNVDLLLHSPMAALGAYHRRCVDASIQSAPAWPKLLPSVATLAGAGASPALAGSGTRDDPWRVVLASLDGADASLQAWNPKPDDGSSQLAIGMRFDLALPFKQLTSAVVYDVDFVTVTLPNGDGSGSASAAWVSGVRAGLMLHGPLTTPQLGGMSITANLISARVSWTPSTSFAVEASVSGISVALDPAPAPAISLPDLSFALPAVSFDMQAPSWDNTNLQAFARVVVNIAGLWLAKLGGRFGVAFSAAFGMLPSPSALFAGGTAPNWMALPPGFTLPANWPSLSVSTPAGFPNFFAAPWKALRAQLQALFSVPSTGVSFGTSFAQLFNWSFTGSLPKPGTPTGSGTYDDPFAIPFNDAWGIEVLVWALPDLSAVPQAIGFGLRRRGAAQTVADVLVTPYLRLDIARVSLGSSLSTTTPTPPHLAFTARLENPDTQQPLASNPTTKSTVKWMELGVAADSSGIAPSLTLHDVVIDNAAPADYTLSLATDGSPSFTCTQGMQQLETLMFDVTSALSDAVQKAASQSTALTTVLDTVVAFGLATKTDAVYAISSDGWSAMLANPDTYFRQHAETVLGDPAQRGVLISDIQSLLGIPTPTLSPQANQAVAGAWRVLNALGLAQEVAQGYVLDLGGVLALAQNPQAYLESEIKQLFADVSATKALATALTAAGIPQQAPEQPDGIVAWMTSEGVVTVAIPAEKPIVFGSEIAVHGEIVLDLRGMTASVHTAVATNVFDTALGFTLDVDASANVAWSLALESAPTDRPPAFDPIVFWPMDTDAFVKRLTDEVPAFVLSSIVSDAINQNILNRHPDVRSAAQGVAEFLGVADRSLNGAGPLPIRSIRGILANPKGWLLSPSVLGDGNGNLSLDAVGNLAAAVVGTTPIAGPGGVTLAADGTSGLVLGNLPHKAQIALHSSSASGITITATVKPDASVDLSGTLAFGTGNGVSVSGSANFDFQLDSAELAIGVEYEKSDWTVSATPTVSGHSTTIALVPFGGLNQFMPSTAAGVAVLQYAGESLGTAYTKYKTANPTSALIPFVNEVQTAGALFGIKSAADALQAAKDIWANPSDWIQKHILAALDDTLKGLLSFLSDAVHIPGVTRNGNVLTFTATTTAVPGVISIEVGSKPNGSGTMFGVWVNPQFTRGWMTLGGAFGLGIDPSSGTSLLYFADVSVGASNTVALPAGLGAGPSVLLSVNGAGGSPQTSLRVFPAGPNAQIEVDLLPNVQFVSTGLRAKFLGPLVAAVGLAEDAVQSWLSRPLGSSGVSPGQLLAACQFLTASGTRYVLADISQAIAGLTAEKLLGVALDAIAGKQIINSGGIAASIVKETTGTKSSYGLRFAVTDLVIAGSSSTPRQLSLQLGKWQTGDDAKGVTPWLGRAWTKAPQPLPTPGIGIYALQYDSSSKTYTFHPRLELASIGVDWSGSGNKPLASIKGVVLGGIEPRIYLNLDSANLSKPDFGASIRCDGLGLPLGPSFGGSSSNSNPVAENLLSSNKPASGSSDAVNPTFAATISFVDKIDVEFHQQAGPSTPDEIWLQVGRALGPLFCQKLGIGWESASGDESSRLDLGFDGSVALAGLEVDVENLVVGVPVDAPTDRSQYTLSLSGIDVSFNGGPVQVSGGFLEQPGSPPDYVGNAIIRAATFNLSASGGYSLITSGTSGDSQPSIFVFAYLATPLGGPPFFFVTGVAAGFGYNRNLLIPGIDGVAAFPLVAAVNGDPSKIGDGTREGALKALEKVIPPARGVYWVAAGVQFTSFELINSFALLTVRFGRDFEIALLGTSRLSLPKPDSGMPTYLYTELALEVIVDPGNGVFSALAELTANSWVLDHACRLTGGFAFNIWFHPQNDGVPDHAGDFVLTIGGYHPRFVKPSHYPDVPRLGFNWPVSGNISITGGAYFALTPSCVMAGGNLNATYQSGDLRAWFDAYADFLISWHPFHYDIQIGVSIGASYRLSLLFCTVTVSVELGASVHIWGPQLKGEVHVTWYIISFTVGFGADSVDDPGKTIEWGEFRDYFLPQPPAKSAALLSQAQTPVVDNRPVCRVTVTSGLSSEIPGANGGLSTWVVLPSKIAFATESTIPASQLVVGTKGDPAPIKGQPIGIRPMGSLVLTATHTILVEVQGDDKSWSEVPLHGWNVAQRTQDVPAALWNTVNDGSEQPGADVLPGRLTGFSNVSPPPFVPTGPVAFDMAERITYHPLPVQPLPLANATPPARASRRALLGNAVDPIERIKTLTMSADVLALRNQVVAALGDLGHSTSSNGPLDLLAAYADITFQSLPMLGNLGTIGQKAGSANGSSSTNDVGGNGSSKRTASPSAARTTPRLRAAYRRYASGGHDGAVSAFASVATVTADTMFATLEERRTLDAFSKTTSLDAGLTLLWDLDGVSPRPGAIAYDGVLPLRVVMLDEHQRVLSIANVAAGSSGQLVLPTAAHRVSVTALAPAAATTRIGWHATSALLALTPNALLGDGVVVRTQSPVSLGRRGLPRKQGVIDGRAMVARNRVGSGKRGVSLGWVETRLPAGFTQLQVQVEHTDSGAQKLGATSMRLSIRKPLSDGQAHTEETIAPAGMTPNDIGHLITYVLPATDGGVTVRATPALGATVHGMTAAPSAAALTALVAEVSSKPPQPADNKRTTIQFVAAKESANV